MAKVPISGATKVVWQRYCQSVGIEMGKAVALLIVHELASVAGEDAETLADRIRARETELNARAQDLRDQEKELKQRDRSLFLRVADLEDREKEVAAREQNVAVLEQSLAQQLQGSTRVQPAVRSKPKPGRNEPCWCGSGKQYKICHLGAD
jgi:uncharacterized protein YecA (UPF0149 family)